MAVTKRSSPTYSECDIVKIGNLFDPSLQFFVVTVNNLGRIDKATWKVPVPR